MQIADKPFDDARDWFRRRRSGLFLHWGIYAVPAWHEQIQWRRPIPGEKYATYADQFNPVEYDPDRWLDHAEEAGMQYVCFTTKHHDGFCMWDTDETDFKITSTPYGRDVLEMLADACHRRDFPLCLYYSVVDWHHPNYPNQGRSHELDAPKNGDDPDLEKYLGFLRAQVRELCTRYGELGGFWWDMNVTEHTNPSINEMIRKLQPGAVINNRGFDEGDYGTPERDLELEQNAPFKHLTEACQSIGKQSWGYREDEDYYTLRQLRSSIDYYLSRGGNYLLNVGPTARGNFPSEAVHILRNLGQWYDAVREALHDADPVSGLLDSDRYLTTRRDNTLYVHLHRPLICDAVDLAPFHTLPREAILLNTGEEVECDTDWLPWDFMKVKGGNCAGHLRVKNIPADELCGQIPVFKLEFEDLDAARE
ncbi:MAG: alpha-L-fucosidase [Candidatus Brocadiia bacterium]